jgi:hypothetical protein
MTHRLSGRAPTQMGGGGERTCLMDDLQVNCAQYDDSGDVGGFGVGSNRLNIQQKINHEGIVFVSLVFSILFLIFRLFL